MTPQHSRRLLEHFTPTQMGRRSSHDDSAVVLLVLGNKPLDEHAASLDNLRRAVHAARLYHSLANVTAIIASGGRVVANVGLSEALQIAAVLLYYNVPPEKISAESYATTTGDNAKLAKRLMRSTLGESSAQVLVVTKASHAKRAVSTVRRKLPNAVGARPHLVVTSADMMQDIQIHLAWRRSLGLDADKEKNNASSLNGFLRWRFNNLVHGMQRTD